MITLIEAVREDGEDQAAAPSSWRVRLVRAGASKNGNNYPLNVLHEAVPLYEGVRALSRADDEHASGRGKSARNTVGWFTGATPVAEGIDATFNISAAAGWLKTMFWDAWTRGKKDIVGFSHVVEADASNFSRNAAGKVVRNVRKIARVDFVDVVVDPSAGGEIVGLAESNDDGRSQIMNIEKLLKLIETLSPDRFKALDTTNVTEAQLLDELEAISQEHTKKTAEATAPGAAGISEAVTGAVTEALKSMRDELKQAAESTKDEIARDRAVSLAESMVSASPLPEESLERILAQVSMTPKPATKGEIEKFIAAEAKYLGLTRGWSGPGSSGRGVTVMRDQMDKWKAGLDGLLSGERRVKLSEAQGDEIDSYRSIREAYIDATGDREFTGEGLHKRLAEATMTTNTFGGALGDSIRRAMQKEYKQAGYDEWRKIVTIGQDIKDFRVNYRPQVGGFSALEPVTQDNQYGAFTTEPDDFTPYYSVTKYGRTQVITMETIVNDDVGLIRRIPIKIGRAAARTLNTNVWAPIISNAAVSASLGGTGDAGGDLLFIASTKRGPTAAGNLGSDPMSFAAIVDGRTLMMKQTEPQSGERLNIGPKYLWGGVDLEQLMYELCYAQFQPSLNVSVPTAQDAEGTRKNFLQRFGLEPIVVPHQSDSNDWGLIADPNDIPTMEVGFLGGRQEPELFIADQPTSDVGGAGMFSYDRIIYKVRHIYGVAVLDFRSMYASLVA